MEKYYDRIIYSNYRVYIINATKANTLAREKISYTNSRGIYPYSREKSRTT